MKQHVSIDPAAHIGTVALTVSDLKRSTLFYTQALGFTVISSEGETALLGVAGVPLLELTELAGATPFPRRATGLYHFAILVPTRADLGRWLRHWLEIGGPLPGQGDHLVSEALYLSDLDGNGIEIYRDRPRDAWEWDGAQVRMAVDPVDIEGVLAEAEAEGRPYAGFAPGTYVGHIHLQIGDIPQAQAFYSDILGFDVTAAMPSALFVSAGGYHHHIGLNTWASRGAPPAPAGSAGLRSYTVELPSEAARAEVVARLDAASIPHTTHGSDVAVDDPWHNTILLRVKE